MAPKRKLSATEGGTPKRTRKDPTAPTPPTRHSRRQAGEAPETPAHIAVDPPPRKKTARTKTKAGNATRAPAPISRQHAQYTQEPVPIVVDIAMTANNTDLPRPSNHANPVSGAAIDANPIGPNELIQGQKMNNQKYTDTTSEATIMPLSQPLITTEPTSKEPTGNEVDSGLVSEHVHSLSVPDLELGEAFEGVPRATEVPDSGEVLDSTQDTVHDNELGVQAMHEPENRMLDETIKSPDLATVGRQLLQQAAEEPLLDETSVQGSISQELTKDSERPQTQDTGIIPESSKDTQVFDVNSGNAAKGYLEVGSQTVETSPQDTLIYTIDHPQVGRPDTFPDEPVAPEAYIDVQGPEPTTEDLHVLNTTSGLDEELFGEDLSPLDVEGAFVEPEPALKVPSSMKPIIATPPTPATRTTQSQVLPTVRPFKDLMSLRAEDRETEAKYQIASQAGLNVRDYSEKFGKDAFRKQAKELIHQRVLEDQKEAENFFKELNPQPSPAYLISGGPVTPTQLEDSESVNEHAELDTSTRKTIYRPPVVGNDVHSVDLERRKPGTKNYAGGVKKMDDLKTSFLGDTHGLAQDVHGAEYKELPKKEVPKRKYDPDIKVDAHTATATMSTTVMPQFVQPKPQVLKESGKT